MVNQENHGNPGYEKRDVNIKKLVLWGIVGAVIVVISPGLSNNQDHKN
jgi:hypothetical protein